MPPVTNPSDIYAADRPNQLSPVVANFPERVYVPNHTSNTVTEIDPKTFKIIRTFAVPRGPQHVVPSWDLKTLWVNDDEGNHLTPIDPMTGLPGKSIYVHDPYNLYFTPNGKYAIVMAEADKEMVFRDPHTMAIKKIVHVSCEGLNHADFTADGNFFVASCEFSGTLILVNTAQMKTFYIADMMENGVWVMPAAHFGKVSFIHTGVEAHGLYVTRDSKYLLIANRDNKIVAKWKIPNGGSPDMGGISADGTQFWVSGRYNNVVYVFDIVHGKFLRSIAVGKEPHGLAFYPQPATFLVGLFDILANVSRRFRAPVHKLNNVIPVFLNGTALATAIFTGLVLMILARGLSRRKRRAWVLAIIILVFRSNYEIIGSPSYRNIFLFIVEGFIGITGPIKFTSERSSDLIAFTLGTFGVFTLIVPLWLYFRRVKPIPKMSDEDMEIVRKLIRHDLEQDSLGYFATRRDKSVVWASNRKAGIAYRVQGGVMLASGDPFGEYSLWPEAIAEFMKIADEHAWTPAVMGCSDRGGEVWVEHAGMIAIDIGDEAIIDVKDFTLEGRPMANVRQMVNRIKRKGYSCTTHKWSELEESTRSELRTLAHEWRYGVAERGFSMSMDRFGQDFDPDTYITIAWLNNEIKGLLYYVPWTTNGLSLDRMQRERGTDPGVNELMIVETVEYARANNLAYVSLNFAAFRSLFERADKISADTVCPLSTSR
eukprot:gene5868-5937_t